MSHEFESGFFVAEAAWHGLGTVLQQPPTTQTAIAQAGLDWRVLEEPVLLQADAEAEPELRKKPQLCKKLVRDRDQQLLGTVAHDYVPLQNEAAFRWFDPFLEKGQLELNAAGSLRQGQRIWILARLKNVESAVTFDDWVRPYLLLHNSHDGSTAAWLQFTPIRVVCMNTLAGATGNRFGDLWQRKAVCVPHSLGLPEQLAKLQNLVDLTRREFQISVEEYQAMASQEVNQELLDTYFGSVLFGRNSWSNGLRSPNLQRNSAWSQLASNFEQGRGNQGKTLWDAYNAVTEWLTYQRQPNAADRLDFNWFGGGVDLRRRAHETAIALLQNQPTPAARKRDLALSAR